MAKPDPFKTGSPLGPAARKPKPPPELKLGAPPAPPLKKRPSAQKKAADKLIADRQAAATQRVISGRVSAKAGLTPTTDPFAGASKTHQGARTPVESELSANSQLAKRRLQLLNSGGLELPAPARKREQAAIKKVSTSRAPTFADTHQLPWELAKPNVRLSPAERTQTLRAAFNAPVNTGRTVDPTKPGFFMSQMSPGFYGQGHPGYQNVDPIAIQGGINSLLGKLRTSPGKVPDAYAMPLDWLKEIFGAKAEAATGGKPLTLQNFLTDEQRYGKFQLGTKARKALTAMMVKRGWNAKDAPNLTDIDLASRAFNDYNMTFVGALRNTAAGAGILTSLPSMVEQVGQAAVESVKQRSAMPLAHYGQQFAQQWANELPLLGDRPYGQILYNDPVAATAALLPIGKFGSRMVGRGMGLKPLRRVELPTVARQVEAGTPGFEPGSQFRDVPASVHPIMRGYQALGDRVMAKAQTPEELAARAAAPDTVRGIPADIRQRTGNAVARQGHRIEGRAIKQDRLVYTHQARLEKGHDPHVAMVRYHQALQALPFLGKKPGSKANTARSVVFHGHIGKDSAQVAEYYTSRAKKSDGFAADYAARAADERAKAEAARADGSKSGAYEADQRLKAATDWELKAKEMTQIAADQRAQAKWSLDHPHDPSAPATPEQQNLLQRSLEVSRQQDALLESGGKFNEKGSLYGRLQHNLAVTLETEGPNTVRGGKDGTPLWHEANRIMNPDTGLRALHNAARDRLYGNPHDTESSSSPTPASHDSAAGVGPTNLRSPEAEHQLGRYNRLNLLWRVGDAIGRQREQRALQREQRAGGAFGTAEDTALAVAQQHAAAWGINPGVLERMRTQAQSARDKLTQEGESKAARAEKRAQERSGTEQSAHNAAAIAETQRLTRELESLRIEGRPRNEIAAVEQRIQQISEHAQAGYEPGRKVLLDQSTAEKTRLLHGLRQLPNAAIEKIISDNLTSAQVEQIGHRQLHDMLMEHLDRSSPLDATLEQIRQKLEDATGRYIDKTGLDPQLAAEYQLHDQHYRQRLKAYEQMLTDQGVQTGHIRLQDVTKQDKGPVVRVTKGTQFEHGNFGHDVHLYLSRDLEGLTNKAVEARMYELISREPYVIHNPDEGAAAPPGFAAVSMDNWHNMTSPTPNRGDLTKMFEEWRNPTRAEPVQGKQIWISSELQRQIMDLQRDPHTAPAGINGLLKATNLYRRWMLYMLPRTFINNAVGNPVMAMIMGASMRDWREAMWTLRNHPERVMGTLRGRGPIRNASDTGLFGWQAFWRHHNTFQEDNANLMVYLMHARKAFKQENNLKWFNHVSKMDELWGDFLKRAARGENPDAYAWGRKSAQAFGDMRDSWKLDPTLATLTLFHRWVAHMLYLTLWSLPVHYPGRFAVLVQASELAQQYEKKHGVWPEWAQGMIPLLGTNEKLPGGIQKMLWSLSTQGINPFATPGQTFDLGSVAQPKFPGQSILAANLSPGIRVPLEFLTGHRLDTLQPFKDRFGNDIQGLNWRELTQNVIANTPIANTVWSRAGMSDESIQAPIPFIGQSWPRYSSKAKVDPAFGSPSAFGHSFWQDWLLRLGSAAGVTVRPLDVEGPRSARSIAGQESFMHQQAVTHQRHQAEANVRALRKMTPAERKQWFFEHDKPGYLRQDWLRIKP